MAAMRFSKSTPDSTAPSTSSLAPNTPLKRRNFSSSSSIDPLVGGVALVEEVDHHHVELLAVAVAAADALLDALGVPGQVVVDHQIAELQVDALGGGLGGDHDGRLVAEIFHQRGPHVGAGRAGDAVGAGVLLQPALVDVLGLAGRCSCR